MGHLTFSGSFSDLHYEKGTVPKTMHSFVSSAEKATLLPLWSCEKCKIIHDTKWIHVKFIKWMHVIILTISILIYTALCSISLRGNCVSPNNTAVQVLMWGWLLHSCVYIYLISTVRKCTHVCKLHCIMFASVCACACMHTYVHDMSAEMSTEFDIMIMSPT